MNFNNIPIDSHLRVKELMLIFQSVNLERQNGVEELTVANFTNVLTWIKKLQFLVGVEQAKTFGFETFSQGSPALLRLYQQTTTVLNLPGFVDLLKAVEEYQTSPDPLQWSNFGSQFYYKHHLANKIDLLYKIGSFAKILNFDEKFDSYTRVNQKTQDVCNRVCQWVENNLWLKMPLVNVYEPFIWDCQNYSHLCEESLQEIGLRSGLLTGELNDKDHKISLKEAQLVVDWVQDNFGVKLSLPSAYQLSSEPVHNHTPHALFKNPLTRTVLLAWVAFLISPIFNQFYRQIFAQPTLTLHESLLRLEAVKKYVPLQ